MHGTGVPLVTPFDESGDVDEAGLRGLVDWVVNHGVDFLVPAGSTSEAPLLSIDERARVIEVVADAAPDDVPVLAGTGHPGLDATRRQTALAADAGADAALVVTPFYYPHDDDALVAYYHDVADASPIPVYLYSVPQFTGVALSPEAVRDLAAHDAIAGMKDSSGDLEAFQRERRLSGEAFELFVGAGGVYAPALDAGAGGGILALANVVPELASEVFRLYRGGDRSAARRLNSDLVELNRAVTSVHGITGLKAGMRRRGAPAGHARRPFQPVEDDTADSIGRLVDSVLDQWAPGETPR